ncbi:MAG: tetratricopeptide repeat protein [Caulobacteraceae bacterium]|nr:tetratricopeptide repeat protein [Caulobacteraceae bacterium]
MLQRQDCRPRDRRRGLTSLAALVAVVVSGYAVAGPSKDRLTSNDPGGVATAAPVLQWSAERGSATAQRRLGLMYMTGQGVGQDNGQAAKWFSMAADQGDVGARTLLIALCSNPQGPPLPPCAPLAADIRARAVRGDPQAAIELGSFYLVGAAGLPKDPAAGVGWYRKAATQGDVRAEFQLGLVYGSGLMGVAADPGQSMSWFRKAADQGDLASMRTLAMAYQSGLYGVAKDPAQAEAWYLKAANAGDLAAQSALAAMYAGGDGAPEAPVQAVFWYRKAAEQGDANAAAAPASAYAGGKGAPHDDVQALIWIDVAIALAENRPGGVRPYWIDTRELIGRRLTYSQLVDAETQAAALKARLATHDQPEGEGPGPAFGY